MRAGERRHYVKHYRGTEAAGRLGSVTTTWEDLGNLWAGMVPAFLTLRNYGAGESTSGRREFEFRSGERVQARDGLEVLAGSESGTKWRVLSVDRGDRRRVLAVCEPYNGEWE